MKVSSTQQAALDAIKAAGECKMSGWNGCETYFAGDVNIKERTIYALIGKKLIHQVGNPLARDIRFVLTKEKNA